jgi:proteasome assembly chaperone (PAC2) family protein
MGKSSEEFLSLVKSVLDMTEDSAKERTTVLEAVQEKTLQLFGKLQSQKEYGFYCLCANMIDFGDEFKPYLLEGNGCLRCFGRAEVEFEAATISSLRE